ncbi:hypothetical protein Afil01_18620 [Actinorhabdospora filicis]|uniref:ABC-2 type transport system permease protein n=1 Tax=Actinorhabdospora filicis TaxID=1785913 RepID=A0A9W6SJE9_9ACTN|nr:ABC transporter permease subunit [Actinorhabdospora filicis]GLZ77055.1 hypothetical protein Afil01_18620 [Actinorhabdospora filicis]
MKRSVYTQALRDQRRSLLIWAIALAGVAFIYIPSYQTYRDQGILDMKGNAMFDAIGVGDLASPVGYLNSAVFALMGPLLMIIFAVSAGARTAGQEESGVLDLLLAQPIGRVSLLLQRFAALATATALLTGAFLLALVGAAAAGDMDVPAADIAAATVGLGLLALLFGALTLLIGAASGRRAIAIAGSAVLAVLSYFANTLGADWLRHLSPFYHFNGQTPLANGWQWSGLAVLAGLTALAITAGAWRFGRRDLAV